MLSGTTISLYTSLEQPVIVAWSDTISYVNEPSVTLEESFLSEHENRLIADADNAAAKINAVFLLKACHSSHTLI